MEGLELFVVDDVGANIVLAKRASRDKGYKFSFANNSYDAIDKLAIRINKGEGLPDIYLCDMLDRDNIIAKMKDGQGEMQDVYATMAFNIMNYLRFKEIVPDFFIGWTSAISKEDESVARDLDIVLLGKEKTARIFPDVSELNRDEALQKFRENYSLIKGSYNF